MKKISIEGGQRLNGKIEVSGMKNSALPIIFSCLLVDGECILENVPVVSDVENALAILRHLGAVAEFVDDHTVKIDTRNAVGANLNIDLISKMRASSYLISTCLVRFGEVHMPYPGGCNFGSRPIEQHIKGIKKLGARGYASNDFIDFKQKKKLKSSKIRLDKISVGATINMIMSTVLLDGESIIENVAKEPHVIDLICFLNSCGADILHMGTYIKIKGVKALRGIKYRIYSDTIEALTFLTCVGATGGKLTLENVELENIRNVTSILERMNMEISYFSNKIEVISEKLKGTSLITSPYPGFPTDIHPQFSSLLCYCDGGGEITETIFSGRFAYAYELEKMGAKLVRKGNTIRVFESQLHGASLDATDLRAGAALIVASLGAEGKSVINNVNYIVRGYENLPCKLASVGANIKLIQGE